LLSHLHEATNTANAPAEKLHAIFSLCEETESLNDQDGAGEE
jgi:hypothetical protein